MILIKKGSLGKPKWFFYGITAQTLLETWFAYFIFLWAGFRVSKWWQHVSVLSRFPDALLSKWLHCRCVYPQDCFVCVNRCCVISRCPAHCVSYWLPMSFLIQGNVGVCPDLYLTWHTKGRFRIRHPCELSETAYEASQKKLKKCCNPHTPLCPNALTMTYTHTYDSNKNTHTSQTHS